MEKLSKKYGILTAIAMVVGVVIGSGVFFKADDVLIITEGNLLIGLGAWIVGAFAMIFGAMVFAEFAGRIEKSNGIVDYYEEAFGSRAGYLVGWFNGVLYFTPLSAILSWVASLYTMLLFGSENPEKGTMTWILAIIYMLLIYTLNYFTPMLAGKFQVGTMFIKLVPLFLIAIVGTISGLFQGVTVENFSQAAASIQTKGSTFSAAVVATAFAYEGWIIAVTLNSEIKDAKKNLPKALVIGTFIVFLTYVVYFLGIAGVLPTETIMAEGDGAVSHASEILFGSVAGTLLTAFVVVSCLGTLNGLVMSCIRIPYSLAIRNQGPIPAILSQKGKKREMPTNATIYALILSMIYLLLWYASVHELFGRFIAVDEIPIVMVYGLYFILYIWYMKNFKDLSFVKRYVVPICAMLGAGIILYGGITNPSIGLYLLISVGVLIFGNFFYRKGEKIVK